MKKKIKIGFVAENAIGGIISVITGLISLLDKDKFEFNVALINFEWRNVNSAEHIFKLTGIDPYILTIGHSNNKYQGLKKFQKNFLQKQDLIVASSKYELLACSLGNLQIPVIMMIHTDMENDAVVCNEFKDLIDIFVSISDTIQQNLIDTLGVEFEQRIRRMNHAIPDYQLNCSNPFSEDFTIAFIGRYNMYKGADYLIEIGNYLYKKTILPKFVLITDGVNESEFKQKWKYIYQTDFYSNISNFEVQKLLADANVILMPSRNEGFPVSLVEAMRRGVVPICSNIKTGFPELINHNENGFLINLENISQFGETIIALSGDRNRLNKMSKTALQSIDEKFNPKKNAEAYEKLFLEVVKNQKPKYYSSVSQHLGRLDKPYLPNFIFKLLKRIDKFKIF